MKKILSLIIAVVMIMSTMACVSADGNVATTVSTSTELAGAVSAATSGDVITLENGEYELPLFSDKELTFKGVSKEGVIVNDAPYATQQGWNGSTFHFENLTAKGATENYHGLANGVVTVTYTDCNINNLRFLYATDKVVFENCAFKADGVEHSFWTYGASNVIVNNCTFTYKDRAVNCYSESGANHETNISFTKCSFKYTGTSEKPEGAVEINSGSVKSIDISFEDCTAPENGAMWFNSQWDSEKGKNTVVEVDGETVWEAVDETSTHSRAYTSKNTYWGQCRSSADESFEFKFYNNDTYMGYTSLINIDGIIDGDVEVSWHIKLGIGTEEYTSDCGYWKMKWDIEPTVAMQPTRVEHWVDGVKAAECALEPNWADSIFPVVAAVTDNNGRILSYVNNHEGATLANAFTAGGNIVMLKDVTLSEALTVSATTTLDLNGKAITYNSTTQGEAMITNKGNLTINDSGETGVINYNYTGEADSSYGKGNYTISNGGTLTVNGGKITIANLSGHAKYPIDNNSTTGDAILVINGGHLYNYNTSAIRQFCNSTTNKNSVTIDGGLVEGYCAIWVQNPGSKTVNGSLSIKNGEIKSTAKAWVNGTAELKDVSSRIYCTIDGEGGAWSEDSAVSITGGTINENVSLAEEAPAAITIGDEATFNGYVDIPEEEVDKTLPNAEVKNIGSVTIPANGYSCYPSGDTSKDLELDVAMQFIAKDTPEEAAKNYYGNYTTDFFIEFDGLEDGSFDTTGCYLAGNYGDWGWIAIPVNTLISTVEEGVVYPVLSSQGDMFDFKYVDICREVKDFTCGIYFSDAVKAANPNITVKLSLGLCESLQAAQAAQFTTVGAYTYDQDDFGKQLVNWGTGTDAGYYMDGETKYGMMRFLFAADIDAEDVVDSGIKYVRTDNIAATVVSKKDSEATNAFYGDITGIPEGTTGEYAAVAYIVTTKGLIYWSDVAVCSPSFTKHFTGYTAQ